MKCFVKDLSTTMQVRMVIFGMQVDDVLLYRGIENECSPAYSSLYLFSFLSFHTLKNKIVYRRMLTNMQARIVIFGMQVDKDLWYCEIENQSSPAESFLYKSNFLSVHTLKNDFTTTMQAHICIQVDDHLLYHGIENQCSPASCICPIFLSCHTSNNEIFVKEFSTNMQARLVIFGMQVDDDL